MAAAAGKVAASTQVVGRLYEGLIEQGIADEGSVRLHPNEVCASNEQNGLQCCQKPLQGRHCVIALLYVHVSETPSYCSSRKKVRRASTGGGRGGAGDGEGFK